MLNLSLFKKSSKTKKQSGAGLSNPMTPANIISVACQKNLSVNVSSLESLDIYKSKFLGTDNATGSFHIASVKPIGDGFLLTPDKTSVRFNFELHNVHRRFKSRYSGIWAADGIKTLQFFTPEQIETIQRREYYRVSPGAGHPVMVQFRYERMETSETIDISGGGVSFLSASMIKSGVKFGIRLDIPNEKSINTKVETRGCSPLGASVASRSALLAYKVRTKFSHLTLADSRAVGHYIAKRQRETS